jgi:ferritin-like metal-binding protein YciE
MPSRAARHLLIVGLRNAHAMESQAHELMQRQAERLDDFPQVQARLRQHVAETQEQIRRLEKCLDDCGEAPSGIKDALLSLLGNVTAFGHALAGDEILKNTFANHAFEHYEIAAYKALLTLARQAGLPQIGHLLQASLQEEERMAAWLDGHIEEVTLAYLAREERRAA